MSNTTVDISAFGSAFDGILEDFAKDCEKKHEAAVRAGGKKAKDMLQQTKVPGATGEYASGWQMKMDSESFGGKYARVHNAKKPSLTHLLELGHEKFVYDNHIGGRVPGYPHIEPAYNAAVNEMLRRLNHG